MSYLSRDQIERLARTRDRHLRAVLRNVMLDQNLKRLRDDEMKRPTTFY